MGPRIYYDSHKKIHCSYPPDTKAFLYYFTSPEKPRIAGELRLRVASDDDPGSFERGSDLLKPNGRLWSRPLYVLSKFYIPLYEKLREERLVSDDLHAVLSTFPPNLPKYPKCQFLYTLNDTFTIDFSMGVHSLFIITERGANKLNFVLLFSLYYPTRIISYRGAYTNDYRYS